MNNKQFYFEILLNENISKLVNIINKLNIINYSKESSIAETKEMGSYKFFYNSSTNVIGYVKLDEWRNCVLPENTSKTIIMKVPFRVNSKRFEQFTKFFQNVVFEQNYKGKRNVK